MGDSDDDGEVLIPDPTDIPDLVGALDVTVEHRYRNSIQSFQRFICDHYRIDETVVLTNAYLRKGDGLRQTEMVEKESSKSRIFGYQPTNYYKL